MTTENRKIRVLYIDDELYGSIDPNVSLKIQTIEKKGDIEICAATDASMGIDLFCSQKPDIIVLDIMMAPGENFSESETRNGYESGFAFLKRIRDKYDNKIPVIVLTAYPKRPSEETLREFDIAEYLAKPTKMATLADLIREYYNEGNSI